MPKFDAAQFLRSKEEMVAYLTAALEENDASLLADALGDVAKAHGMRKISKATGLAREGLYKALRAGAEPRVSTVSQVLRALGLKLVIAPASN